MSNSKLATGSYAVTTVYSMPWLSKKSNTIHKPKTRQKKEKPILHPIYEKCSQVTQDPFWISIMRECARGKFPRCCYIKHGSIIYRRGNKTERLDVDDPEDPEEVFYRTKDFFRRKVGLVSNLDKEILQKEEEEKLADKINQEFQWKNIKVSRVKEMLVTEYVSDLSQKCGFDEHDKDELYTLVKLGLMLKCFGKEDIEMENGKITYIHGLVQNEDGYFEIDPAYMKKAPKNKISGLGIEKENDKPAISYIKLWQKYLESLDKKTNKTLNDDIYYRSSETISFTNSSSRSDRTGNSSNTISSINGISLGDTSETGSTYTYEDTENSE